MEVGGGGGFEGSISITAGGSLEPRCGLTYTPALLMSGRCVLQSKRSRSGPMAAVVQEGLVSTRMHRLSAFIEYVVQHRASNETVPGLKKGSAASHWYCLSRSNHICTISCRIVAAAWCYTKVPELRNFGHTIHDGGARLNRRTWGFASSLWLRYPASVSGRPYRSAWPVGDLALPTLAICGPMPCSQPSCAIDESQRPA